VDYESNETKKVKLLSNDKKIDILMNYKEVEIHKVLKTLFSKMQQEYVVEITHGSNEFGKDLILIKSDRLLRHVTAVIVKVGHVGGKTADDVDEIENKINKACKETDKLTRIEEELISQIRQASDVPAESKFIFNKLPIDRIFVVIVGTISGNARKRLEAFVDKDCKIRVEMKDIIWLIDELTQYYPEIFIVEATDNVINDKIIELESANSLGHKNIYLSKYFVDPLVATIDIPVKFDEEKISLILREKKIQFIDLEALIKENKRIIIVGDPGTGKSSALAKIAVDKLKKVLKKGERAEEKIKTPVFIQAKDILNINNGEELLSYFFKDIHASEKFLVDNLILDALDEVPIEDRANVIERAKKMALEHACSLIISSRKIDIVKETPQGFEKYEILPFEFKQAMKFFENIISDKTKLTTLKDGLEKIKNTIPLLPLSLVLLIEIIEERQEIPASITELFQRYFDVVLGRFDDKKGIKQLFEYQIKKKFLSELAFTEFLSKEKLEIQVEDFKVFLNIFKQKFEYDDETIKSFINEIERAGIIDIKSKVFFKHRSFLDYFAGLYIYDKQDEIIDLQNKIVDIFYNDIWGDSSFFYIGLKREVSSSLLEKILLKDTTNLSSMFQKFMVGKIIQAGWNTDSATKMIGIEKASETASILRDKFMEVMSTADKKTPQIYADFWLLAISEISFGSTFLFKEVNKLLLNINKADNYEKIYQLLVLSWAMKRFLLPQEKAKISEAILEQISKVINNKLQESRLFLILELLEKDDKKVIKKIEKKLNKLKAKQNYIFGKLLPHAKKGFRAKKHPKK
jgi:GTPase SAR1 family protein